MYRKERKVFETYHKELRTTRDKKEKEELGALQEEVSNAVSHLSLVSTSCRLLSYVKRCSVKSHAGLPL